MGLHAETPTMELVLPWFGCSSSTLILLSSMEHAEPELVQPGVLVHLALHQFESVDLPFGLCAAHDEVATQADVRQRRAGGTPGRYTRNAAHAGAGTPTGR